MSAERIINDLAARGVSIWAEANILKIDAPVGALTDEDKAILAAHKTEILEVLASAEISDYEYLIRELDAPEAEWLIEQAAVIEAACGVSREEAEYSAVLQWLSERKDIVLPRTKGRGINESS